MAVVRVIQASVRGKSEVAFDSHAVQRMANDWSTEEQVVASLQETPILRDFAPIPDAFGFVGIMADTTRLMLCLKRNPRESW